MMVRINTVALKVTLACFLLIVILVTVAAAQAPQPAQYLTELAMQIAEMHADLVVSRNQIATLQKELVRMEAENKILKDRLELK